MSTAPPNGWKGVATEYTPCEITDPTLPTTFISTGALLNHQASNPHQSKSRLLDSSSFFISSAIFYANEEFSVKILDALQP
jgi:hypothetical protein